MKSDEGSLVLRHEATRLTLDPPRGGAIREFKWHGRDILRPTPAHLGDDPRDMACFPMVPYVNRIGHGRFSFGGRTILLSPNSSADPHPLHGDGWRAPWTVLAASTSSARLRFEGGANEWPWRYRCEQSFELVQDGLVVELSIENMSDSPMPAMLGLHPYFEDAMHARLHATLPRVWLTDHATLPVEEAQTPAAWAFEPPRAINEVALDNCFLGWNGMASLVWPDRKVAVRAARCRHLHIYAPAARDFFCIEPQSAAAGALARGAGEATIVAPGKRFAIRVDFAVGTP